MDYARNKLYFDPIAERDPEENVKPLGCGPFVAMGIGALMMFSGEAARSIQSMKSLLRAKKQQS